jgi:hypothetical protein
MRYFDKSKGPREEGHTCGHGAEGDDAAFDAD